MHTRERSHWCKQHVAPRKAVILLLLLSNYTFTIKSSEDHFFSKSLFKSFTYLTCDSGGMIEVVKWVYCVMVCTKLNNKFSGKSGYHHRQSIHLLNGFQSENFPQNMNISPCFNTEQLSDFSPSLLNCFTRTPAPYSPWASLEQVF